MSNENTSKEYLKIIADILTEELDLAPAAGVTDASKFRVFIDRQNFVLPTYSDMFIVLKDTPGTVISNSSYFDGVGSASNEIQEMVMRKVITIDILSATRKSDGYCEARDRKEEVIMALASNYSQQQQEANGFRLFTHFVSFVDSSEAEAGSMLTRYTASIVAHCRYVKTKAIDSYISFPVVLSNN